MAFIVFEGPDGAGKSSQALALLQQMETDGYPVILTREPGGTPLGESLRIALKSSDEIEPLSELFLFLAARSELVETVIKPALEKNINVISDRFTASTIAYQGHGQGLDLTEITRLNQLVCSDLAPDLTILLDLPANLIPSRKSDDIQDKFDFASTEFHHKVRQGYLSIAKKETSQWLVLDATKPKPTLSAEIWEKIRPLL